MEENRKHLTIVRDAGRRSRPSAASAQSYKRIRWLSQPEQARQRLDVRKKSQQEESNVHADGNVGLWRCRVVWFISIMEKFLFLSPTSRPFGGSLRGQWRTKCKELR